MLELSEKKGGVRCTLSDLLMISINGPALEFWQPRPYVVRWLQNGHRGALNKPTGPPKQKTKLHGFERTVIFDNCMHYHCHCQQSPCSDKSFVPEDNGINDDLESDADNRLIDSSD